MPDPGQQAMFETVDLPFPMKGLSDTGPYGKQEPETSPDLMNVWPLDSRSGRTRGGTRDGVVQHCAALDGSNYGQCVFQADASSQDLLRVAPPTTTPATPITTTTVTPVPAASVLTGPAPNYGMIGNGTTVLPGDGVEAGYVFLVPNTDGTSVTKTQYRHAASGSSPKGTYLASAWTQNDRCFILTKPDETEGTATLSASLTAGLTSSGTSLIVSSLAPFPKTAPFLVQVEAEEMKVTAVATSTNTLTVSRGSSGAGNGFNGSTQADHAQGVKVNLLGTTYVIAPSGLTATATTINVENGAVFPSSGAFTVQINAEVISVTSRSANVLTVTRSSGVAHSDASPVRLVAMTTLNGGINSSVTGSVVLTSTTQLPQSGAFTVQVDNEQIRCSGVAGSNITVTQRGYNGTTAASHLTGARVSLVGHNTLAAAVTTTTATSITLSHTPSSTTGSFPNTASSTNFFYIQVGSEVMKVTSVSGASMTVARGQNGTTAQTHTLGVSVRLYANTPVTVANVAAVSVTVSSSTLPSTTTYGSYKITLNSERMLVTSCTGAASGTLTVNRGIDGTTIAGHASGTLTEVANSRSIERVQYEIRFRDGTRLSPSAETAASTDLFRVTAGSRIYGMAVQEGTGTSGNFVWIWSGGVQSASVSAFPSPPSVNGDMLMKWAIPATGVLTATGGLIVQPPAGTGNRLRYGIWNSAYAPRHGGLALTSSGVTLAELPNYYLDSTGATASNFRDYSSVRLASYLFAGSQSSNEQLISLPSKATSSPYTAAVVGVPQQLVTTAPRMDASGSGANVLLAMFVDGPGTEDRYKAVSALTPMASTSVTTAVQSGTLTSATSQTVTAREAALLSDGTETSNLTTADQITSVAYHGGSNCALVVTRNPGGTAGAQTVRQYSLKDGGSRGSSRPLSGASLEWATPAPWGWTVAGRTVSGADVALLDHNLNVLTTVNRVGWTSSSNIAFGSTNYVRLLDYTTGTATFSQPGFNRILPDSGNTFQIGETTSDFMSLSLRSAPTANVAITLTSSDTAKMRLSLDGATPTTSPVVVTFKPQSPTTPATGTAKWDVPVKVYAHGVPGGISGDTSATITATVSSGDASYADLPFSVITVAIADSTTEVILSETTANILEGSSKQIGCRLSAAPSGTVTVSFSSSDAGQLTVSPSTLSFTAGNYQTVQYVTLTAVTDSDLEPNTSYTITTTPSGGGYDAATCPDLTITVIDSKVPNARFLLQLAVANGGVYDVTDPNNKTKLVGGTLSTTGVVYAANLGYLVFFADGSSQLMYDGRDRLLKTITTTAGTFPRNGASTPRCVAAWRDRLVWYGLRGDPQNWFMSARYQPYNYAYPAPNTDVIQADQAMSGDTSKAGLLPTSVMTGFIPYNTDLGIFCGDNGMWQMSGDPSAGAVYDEITAASGVGMAFGNAWCKDPLGQIYLMGRTGGIYRMRLNSPPQSMMTRISTLGVERVSTAIDLDKYVASLIWDNYRQGVHFFLVPFDVSATAYWYFFDAASEGWFPQRFDSSATSTKFPLSVAAFDGDTSQDRKLVMAARNGVLYRLSASATDDAGTGFSSYAIMGPITSPPNKAMLNRFLPDHSGASWGVLAGETPALALSSGEVSLGSPSSGVSTRKRVRGRSMYFKASKASGAFSVDRVTADIGMVKN